MNIKEYISIGKKEKPLDRIVTDGGFVGIFRTIGCIGDSLSSGEFESIDQNGNIMYNDFYEYSWGQHIARSTGSKVYNFSRGGMTAKEYIESFADENGFFNADKLCQAYIIALGENDMNKMELGSIEDIDLENYKNNKPTFIGYYAQIIQKIKSLQPRARIFLVSMPKHNEETDQKRKVCRDLLENLCKIFKWTYFIDLYTYAPRQDGEFSKKFWLGHMNPMGYIVAARMIESYIDYIIRKNPSEFAQAGFIGTDLKYQDE